jgi:hypothetical protein
VADNVQYEETVKAIGRADAKTIQRSLLKAQRAAGRYVRTIMRANAPKNKRNKPHRNNVKGDSGKKSIWLAPGWTKKSISVVTFRQKYDGVRLVAVGVKQTAYYASNFVEFGYMPGKRPKAVKEASRNLSKSGKKLSDVARGELGDTRTTKVAPRRWIRASEKQSRPRVLTMVAKQLNKDMKKIFI